MVEKTNAIIQVPESHINRIEKYFEKRFDLNTRIRKKFIFIDETSPKSLLNLILGDDVKVWRYISRIYFYDHISSTFQDIFALELEDKELRVQAYPKEIEEKLIAKMDPILTLRPSAGEFSHYLSVVYLKGRYYYGVNPSEQFFRKPREEDHISRSFYKISEAISRFKIPLNNEFKVLDIGASPGGWTEYMSNHVKKVIAVDPADLKVHRKNVVHYSKRIQNSHKKLHQYKPFDIIMCDINQNPQDTVKIINSLSSKLNFQGFLIMTIKLVRKSRSGQKTLIEKTVESLRENFKNIKVEWLISNTEYERMLYGEKK